MQDDLFTPAPPAPSPAFPAFGPLKHEISTFEDMDNARYVFKGPGQCKSCNAAIEWWITTNEKWMPFDPAVNPRGTQAYKDERAVCHFITCPNAKQHRKSKDKPAEKKVEAETVLQTPELVGKEAAWLAKRHNARCVIVLYGPGAMAAVSVHNDEDAHKLYRDLLTLAESIRNEARKRNGH